MNGYTVIHFKSENYFENGESPTPIDKDAEFEFIIKDKNGNPVSGVSLTTITQPVNQDVLSGFTDSEGIMAFTKVIPGNYTIQAIKEGYLKGNSSFSVVPEETVKITIVLGREVERFSIPILYYWLIILGLSIGVIILYSRVHSK